MCPSINIGKVLTPKNTVAGVVITNMVCRPVITMSNKEIPEDTRKYTATREFCTELFGLANTLIFGGLVEHAGTKLSVKNAFGKMLDKEHLNRIKNTGIESLKEVKDQKVKTGILLSSFVGTALSVAVLTPLLNNLILNKIMKKDKNSAKKPVEQAISSSGTQKLKDENIFKKYKELSEPKN